MVAVAALVLSLAAAAYSRTEAVDQRRVADAAMALRHAASEVGHADEIQMLGGDPEIESLATSVALLQGDHSVALGSLGPVETERVEALLADIVTCGSMLLDAETGEHPAPHDHHELQALLGEAADRAASEALTAENNAGLSLAAACIALLVVGWYAIQSRYQSAQARARAETRLRDGRRLQALLHDSPDCLFVIDQTGRITYRSPTGDRLLPPEADGVDDLIDLAPASKREALRAYVNGSGPAGSSIVFELTGQDGRAGWFDLRVSDLTGDEFVDGYLVSARDITTEIQLRRNLEQQASTDFLTQLPNRRVLSRCLDEARDAVVRTGRPMAVLSLDIDGFKAVNDTMGHLSGDLLLTRAASRLANAVPPGADLIRMGGDEFAVIVPTVSGVTSARRVAQGLHDVLEEPFRLGERLEHVRTSIGLAVTADPDHVSALLGHADVALYEAKRRGGDAIVAYEAAVESATIRKTTITRALREADYDTEFHLVYQPIVNAITQQTTGLEALLRWNNPSLGDLQPDEFVPLAEVTGEICRIGKWVVDRVCQQLAVWIEAGIDPDITVSFNVSARQLTEDGFVPCVLETARRWNVPPDRLVVEVTESAALDHTGRAQKRLHQLRDAGFMISIDDFGSGYSNLGQLLSVPFDVIKIDRSLLLTLSAMRERSGGDPTGPCAIMQAIVSIAGILDAPVVCEGVETEQQRISLQASGITHIQGYLTGRPAPPEYLALGMKAVRADTPAPGPPTPLVDVGG